MILVGNCERLFFFLFVSGCTPGTSQSLALPSPSAPLISSAFVFCYVTAKIGCAQGRAGDTGNGTSGRSKAREGRSKVKRHHFCADPTSLDRGVLYQELSVCLSPCVYRLHLFASLLFFKQSNQFFLSQNIKTNKSKRKKLCGLCLYIQKKRVRFKIFESHSCVCITLTPTLGLLSYKLY